MDDNGWIKFIDAKGNVVIDPKIPYLAGADGYVFHNGHCVLHGDRRDKFGMIDKRGHWVMKADYSDIRAIGHDLYLCKKDNTRGEVLDGKGLKVKIKQD